MGSSDTILRFDLQNINEPAEFIEVQGCEGYLSRNSFGYSSNNSQFYVFGGFINTQATNSVLNFTLTSQTSVTCEVVYRDSVFPSPRQGSTMQYLTGGFYLFGGENQGMLLNDLWFYNITTGLWNEIYALGTIPSPRRRHAADVQGNYMVVVGGYGANEIVLGDYFMFDTDSLTWTQLIPAAGSLVPPAITCTCVMLDLPRFYYVGGRTERELTLAIWEFDLTDSEFTLIHQYDSSRDLALEKHNCALRLEGSALSIYTFFGSQTLFDQPFCGIMRFNLSQTPVESEILTNYTEGLPCLTDYAFSILYDGFYLFAGGQKYKQDLSVGVFLLDEYLLSGVLLGYLSYPAYASGSSYINNTLYIYSGFTNNGIATTDASSDAFQLFNVFNYTNDTNNEECGKGMMSKNNQCEFCPPGTYNDNLFNVNCTLCPLGTANLFSGATDISQCVPCPNGAYSIDPSIPCKTCNSSDICLIGTSNNSVSPYYQELLSNYISEELQPPVYKPPETDDQKLILYILSGSLIFIFIFAFALSQNFRIILSYYDIYKNVHYEIHSTREGEHVQRENIYKPNRFGGFCTVITLIVLIAMSCNTIIDYAYTNVIEDIILVPVGSLAQEHDFGNIDFTFDLLFSSYRGICSNEYLDIDYPYYISLTSGYVADGPVCRYSAKFKSKYIVNSGDSISFNFTQFSSFTSDIIVRLSVDSSVPGYKSSVAQNMSSDSNMIFRGAVPTVFYYSMLPSYYEEKNAFRTSVSNKGYRISETIEISAGSQYAVESIPLSMGLSVFITFLLSDVGISTYKYPQIDFFTLFFKLLSDLPGTIVFIGFLMWFAEYVKHLYRGETSGRYRLAKKEMEEEMKKKQDSFLDTDRNKINDS